MTVERGNNPLILNLLKDGRIVPTGKYWLPSLLRYFYRHSRVSGNPRRDGDGLVFSVPFGVPACAGMTVGAGNDGRKGGKTVERARELREGR